MPTDQSTRCESGLTIEQCATLACLLEAAAPKCGNVHRGADFADLRFEHFLAASCAIGPAIGAAQRTALGQTILTAVRDTRQLCDSNVNLGIILLLAPLATVPAMTPLQLGVERVLHQLKPEDAADVYEAIRLAEPGGLGQVEEHDIRDTPPSDLLLAMRAAEDRDLIARQWARCYEDVLNVLLPWFKSAVNELKLPLMDAIVHLQVQTLRDFPDTLIARKAGRPAAVEVAARAAQVLESGPPGSADYLQAVTDLDFYLRSDGTQRNPGATADLIVATLFAALRDGHVLTPLTF